MYRYFDEFVRLDCAPLLLKLKYFPNGKEITESMGMYNSYRRDFFHKIDSKDSNVVCIVVGDGKYPRTGALFAMRTSWKIYSIDPVIEYNNEIGDVRRLQCIREKLEKVNSERLIADLENANAVVIIHPHSHAKIEDGEKFLIGDNKKYACIVMSCCFEQNMFMGKEANYEYRDDDIGSDKNLIKVFTNL